MGDLGPIPGQLENFTSYIHGLAGRAPEAMVPHKSLNTDHRGWVRPPLGILTFAPQG